MRFENRIQIKHATAVSVRQFSEYMPLLHMHRTVSISTHM